VQLHLEVDGVGERREDQVLVQDGDRGVGLDHVGRDLAGAAGRELHHLGLVALQLDDQVLDVEDDVGHVLHHAGSELNSCGAPLILMAVTAAPSSDESSTRRRRVAHGGAEATLERLDGEAAVDAALELGRRRHARGEFQPRQRKRVVIMIVPSSGGPSNEPAHEPGIEGLPCGVRGALCFPVGTKRPGVARFGKHAEAGGRGQAR
jgi:hypothetical protein